MKQLAPQACDELFPYERGAVLCAPQQPTSVFNASFVHTRSKGMPYFFKIEGEMRVIL